MIHSISKLDLSTLQILNQNNLLHSFIRREIVREKIINIEIDSKKENEFVTAVMKARNYTKHEELDEWLAKNLSNRKKFIYEITSNYKLEKYALEKYKHKVESYFLKKKDSLDQVIYSLIRIKDSNTAQELYLRIAEGEKEFGDIARNFSEGNEKYTRGIIGPIPLNQGHPKLVDLLKSCKEGEINQPLSIEGVHIIIRLEKRQSAELDNNMYAKLATEILSLEIDKEVEAIFRDTIDKYKDKLIEFEE